LLLAQLRVHVLAFLAVLILGEFLRHNVVVFMHFKVVRLCCDGGVYRN
jgi:hypothetical protein